MNLRTRVTVVFATAAIPATTAFPALSGARPIDDKKRQAAELLLRLVFPLFVSDHWRIVEVRFDTGRNFSDRYCAQLANIAPVPEQANGWYLVKVSHAAPLFTRALHS